MWRVVSLQVGRVREMTAHTPPGAPLRTWRSATRKEPVDGPVRLSTVGFTGDEQADAENHGGPEKALLLFPAQHYPRWSAEFPGIGMGPGGFGENLTVDAEEDDVAIGDVLRIGEALVEISQPRVPCWKQAWRWGIEDLVQRMQESGRTGFYGRVLEAGEVQRGDPVARLAHPFPEMTVARLNRARYGGAPAEELRALANCPALAKEWTRWLARGVQSPDPHS